MDWLVVVSSFVGAIGAIPIATFLIRLLEKLALQKNQARHSVLQAGYQTFFVNKMNAYMELMALSYQYSIIKAENQLYYDDYINKLNLKNFETMWQIKSSIQKNRIYLSNNLIQNFDKWHSLVMPIYLETDNLIYEEFDRISQEADAMEENPNFLANVERADTIFEKISNNDNIQKCWQGLLDQINSDFCTLKKKYDL